MEQQLKNGKHFEGYTIQTDLEGVLPKPESDVRQILRPNLSWDVHSPFCALLLSRTSLYSRKVVYYILVSNYVRKIGLKRQPVLRNARTTA